MSGNIIPTDHQVDSWQTMADTLTSPVFPAYPMEDAEMRPVTKITIFGFRLAAVVLATYWLAIFVGTHLPAVIDISPSVNDKIKHFSVFFVLGGLMCYVTTSSQWFRRFMTIGLLGMGYAAIDELTQHFVPGRYPDPWDVFADASGLWAAIGIYVAAKLCYEAIQKTPSAT
jgi:VanZ family protein